MNYHAQYRRLRYELRCAISLTPALYLPLARRKRTDADGATVVAPNTDLVLEGFPRSGNTFAYFAFQMSQPRPLKYMCAIPVGRAPFVPCNWVLMVKATHG
ncbi:hypothetical protein Noc_1512 [Nitrosococcus oceani ATCC 19707]|uniref:Sulfotransferase n=2 Tax=Nitrosococcus oceani TaxID=1229 RepID=Q3JAZ9_NITOC|nr:hypothetical protein [Nitrosococcus oceani]ABA57997.1 hypothetical protein Noc_1512 [Nitrosococcus oceani ATCC 19707]KFI19564.1 hypothetical protein IB75_07945 [Nitrosococcus oceani C-27]